VPIAPAGARTVVDDRGGPQRGAQFAVEGAREHLARAARREGNDDAHHFAPGLGRSLSGSAAMNASAVQRRITLGIPEL